jgi:hypothetical protein
MTPIKKAVATIGKYTDRSGKEKNQYITCGKLLQREDGSFCLKMDAIPVGWNGWLSFYDLDENRKEQAQAGIVEANRALQSASIPDDFNQDIPFSNYEYKGFA